MHDRKREIELELDHFRDLSRDVTDPLAVALMKEVMLDLQAELRLEAAQEISEPRGGGGSSAR